jgi:acetyl esterase/lipase
MALQTSCRWTRTDWPDGQIHGVLDRLVPFNQSQQLAAALEAVGAPVRFHPVEDGGHGQYFGAGGGCGLYADPEVAPMVKAFFATYLK